MQSAETSSSSDSQLQSRIAELAGEGIHVSHYL